MLLPIDIAPEYSLYYIGGTILKKVQEQIEYDFFNLFYELKEEYKVSLRAYVLALDWLYLIHALVVDDKGGITYVSKRT